MQAIDQLIQQIKSNNKILIMFDYDGTLVPIEEKPGLAILDSKTRNQIFNLSENPLLKIALISGRSIRDLMKLSGISNRNIAIFGIHGGETIRNGRIYQDLPDSYKNILRELKRNILDLNLLPGIIVEDKKYSISVHYRIADDKDTQIAKDRFFEAVKSLNILLETPGQILPEDIIQNSSKCCFRYQTGKKVVELVPCSFSKGKAAKTLLSEYPDYLPVYFGDDITDTSAFDEVKKHNGIAILVGNEIDYPADQVVSIDDVRNFIKQAAKFSR